MTFQRKYIVIPIYLAAVALSAYLEWFLFLSVITLPWSVPLMMLSGLVLHMTVYGEKVLFIGMAIGGLLNVFLYLGHESHKRSIADKSM